MITAHIVILSLAIVLVVLAMFVGFAPVSWWVRSRDRKIELFEPDVTNWQLCDEIWIFKGYETYRMRYIKTHIGEYVKETIKLYKKQTN
jgi:hypothetical protein